MKRALLAALAALAFVRASSADVESLSRLFSPGKAVLDLDGDGFPEKPVLTIIIPDKPTAGELALAADVAARANFESLAIDFGLVRRESEISGTSPLPLPVLIGGNLAWVREALKERGLEPASIPPNQGRVFLDTRKGRTGIACVAGSEDALLKTGRAYFLRWPYFWEIWGRESGVTYDGLEKDIEAFLASAGLKFRKTIVREAVYEFPLVPPVSDGFKALSLEQGQIADLFIEVHFDGEADRGKARDALLQLAADQRRGKRTAVLSYPACAALTFELKCGASRSGVVLPRTGATRRMLTPAFKGRPVAVAEGKEFDLLDFFSNRAAYSDQDHDGVPDALDAAVVVAKNHSGLGVADLASRLVLGTAGASFPIVQLDSEIESRKALAAPMLVGANALTAELIKTGKLKFPALEAGSGIMKIVPKAFGKSSALVVHGSDQAGLDETVRYLSRTFPHFADYGEGNPQLADLAEDLNKLLIGEKGGAEAFLMGAVEKAAAEIRGRDLESVEAELVLPETNPPFEDAVKARLSEAGVNSRISVKASPRTTGKSVFEKEMTFTWEVDDAKAMLRDRMRNLVDAAAKGGGVEVSIGVSESPEVRKKVRSEFEAFLEESGFPAARVEILSAYKPGYHWLVENVLPALKNNDVQRLTVRFAEEREDFTRAKRTYAEPARWLQELYPVDEVFSRELGIPLERITFEISEPGSDIYRVEAVDAGGKVVLTASFSPRTRVIPLSSVLPEWGTAKVTTGWLRVVAGGTVVCDQPLKTDLEKFWDFYQKDVLAAVIAHVRKKTGNEPTFSKQPYFKRLLVDLRASEPDYRIGIDQEIISSLESVHDEIYFDTLDLLRGITRFDPEDPEAPADPSRSSAPGNVFPSLHPSLEGGPATAHVVLEDWPSPTPQIVLRWREKGREEVTRTAVFPSLKPKETRASELVFDGRAGRVATVVFETEWEKEADYLAVIELLGGWSRLFEAGLINDTFRFPHLDSVTLRMRHQSQEKEERLTVVPVAGTVGAAEASRQPRPDETIVTTRDILSPSMTVDVVRRLSALKGVRSYIAGKSYEGRDVPVLELFLPLEKYVSLPRVVTFKPTLQVVARQHANEVSSTNYLLRFAELLARDPATREALKKMSFAFEPMENPDGAELAHAMQKNEPFHSLHAGRYGALGVEMGYQTGTKTLLPEAAVRTRLYDRWAPDIFLNLHGYPSHEWVQPFSNYTPYLYRSYWIPRGWFLAFNPLSLPIYEDHREAGAALKKHIAAELNADPVIAASNRRFYGRYERWASRWAPHMSELEVTDGVSIYAKRRGPTEARMTPRTRTTFSEQSPEVMDETATGDWLEFLCAQGLAYLRAHVKYLAQAVYPVVRIEEEVHDRIRMTLVRGRPGKSGA